MKRLFAFIALCFLFSCATAIPVVRHDSTAQREQIADVSNRLKDSVNAEGPLSPSQRAAILQAQDTLKACATTLENRDGEINKLSTDFTELKVKYDALKAEFGLIARVSAWFSALWANIVVGFICIIVGAVLGLFGKTALMNAIPIPFLK